MRLTLSLATVMMSLTAITSDAIEIVSGPYLQNVTDCEATVVWRTDKDALAWVETAPDSVSFAWADSETPAVSSDRIQAGSSPVSTLAAPSEGVSVIWSKSPG